MTKLRRDPDLPEYMAHLAGRRIADFLVGLNRMDYNLDVMARSCYIQGVRDTFEIFERRAPDLVNQVTTPVSEYQI